jgi:hypothetical protein
VITMATNTMRKHEQLRGIDVTSEVLAEEQYRVRRGVTRERFGAERWCNSRSFSV